MRIAIVLSLLLVVALIGGLLLLPRLVAWDDYREELTERAEALTGQSVAIEGRIDLQLLPRPSLTLARATLSSRADAPVEQALRVDRLDLRLKPLPLLGGRFEVDEIRLVRPVLQVAEAEDAGSAALTLAGGGIVLPLAADGPRRLSVVDGRAVLDGAEAGPGQEIEAINLDLVAAGPNGPYTLSGEFTVAAQPFEFAGQLGQTAPEAWSTLQLEVTARADDSPTRLSFRGLSWSDPAAPRLRGELALSGSDARAGLLALDPVLGRQLPPLPEGLAASFRLSGRLEFANLTAALDELYLVLGEVEARGQLQLGLGASPVLDLRLDVPRLRGPEVALPDGEGLAALAALAEASAGQIDLSIGELAWRGGTIRRIRTTIALEGAGGLTVEQARATLPGQSSLGFTGAMVGQGGEAALQGELTLVASDLRSALRWLELEPAEVPEGRLRTLSLASSLVLGDGTLRFVDAELRVDASRLTGSLALSLGGRTRLAGALTLDRLDLDAYWPEGDVRQLVDRTLAAFGSLDAAVEARLERLTWHGVRLQDLVLDGRSVAGQLTVRRLSVHDLAGNQGRLAGELDLAGGTFDLAAELDSTRPAQLLRGLGAEPPLMLARLTPVHAEGTLKGSIDLSELALEVRHQEARLALAGTLDWSDEQPRYDLEIDARHPDYPALLDQMGIPRTTGADRPAGFSMTGRLEGDLSEAAAVVGSLRLGPMSLTGRAGWQRGQPRPRLTLQISAGEPSAAALKDLLASAGLPVDPSLLARPRAGAWSAEPLALRWLTALDAEIELSGKGGVVGPGFELLARLEQGRLTVDRLSASLWGGQIEVQSSLDAWRPLPFMALAVDLRGIDPTAFAAWLDLPPRLEGSVDLYAEATAAGASPRDLIGSLIGDLRIAVHDGRLVGCERLAELHATRLVEAAGAPPLDGSSDTPGASVINADRPPVMAIDDLSGSFKLKRGIATTSALPFELENAPARLEGAIDLLLWVADLELQVGAAEGTTNGVMTLQLLGPLDRPQIRRLTPEAAAPLPEP